MISSILSAMIVASGVIAPAISSSPPYVVKTTVSVNSSGQAVGDFGDNYIGLSFESGTLNSGKFDNAGDLAEILKNLGSGVMRFGGNSVDQPSFTGATPSALAGLARLAKVAGWSVLYSEDLGTFSAKNESAVAGDAKNVKMALGSHLSAVACGNEPDAYDSNGIRGTGYTKADYFDEDAACLSAIAAEAPGVAVAGPDTAGTHWLSSYAASEAGKLGWLDQHDYVLGCSPSGPLPQLAKALLSPAQTAKEVATFKQAPAAAKTAQAKLHISETNTVCDGGVAGLSNSYATALWVIDYMLTGAEHGVDGMNFHGGLDSSCQGYTPLCQVGPDEYAGQPIYYGMAFTHLLGSGQLLQTTASSTSKGGNDAAFALRPTTGSGLRLI